jgi:hypothetical protein
MLVVLLSAEIAARGGRSSVHNYHGFGRITDGCMTPQWKLFEYNCPLCLESIYLCNGTAFFIAAEGHLWWPTSDQWRSSAKNSRMLCRLAYHLWLASGHFVRKICKLVNLTVLVLWLWTLLICCRPPPPTRPPRRCPRGLPWGGRGIRCARCPYLVSLGLNSFSLELFHPVGGWAFESMCANYTLQYLSHPVTNVFYFMIMISFRYIYWSRSRSLVEQGNTSPCQWM